MDSDLILVAGCLAVALSLPAIFSAFADGRSPVAGFALGITGALLVMVAVTLRPGGYRVDEVPDVFARVIARLAG